MADRVEVVPTRDPRAQLDHFVGRKLDDPPAAAADHMIMRTFTKCVFVVRLFHVETHLLEDPALHKQGERSIYGGFPDLVTSLSQQVQDLLGFEVILQIEHGVQDLLPRGRVLDPVVSQVPSKDLSQVVRTVTLQLVHVPALPAVERIMPSLGSAVHYREPTSGRNRSTGESGRPLGRRPNASTVRRERGTIQSWRWQRYEAPAHGHHGDRDRTGPSDGR